MSVQQFHPRNNDLKQVTVRYLQLVLALKSKFSKKSSKVFASSETGDTTSTTRFQNHFLTIRTAPEPPQRLDSDALASYYLSSSTVPRISIAAMENDVDVDEVVESFSLHVHEALTNDQLLVKELQRMYLSNRRAFFAENADGQTVLHVACQLAVAPDILQQLVLLYPDACGRVDRYGRFPLRYLVCHLRDVCDKFGHFGSECCERILLTVIQLMYRAHPEAIAELDLLRQSPVDSAIKDGAPSIFIKLLQNLQSSYHSANNKKLNYLGGRP